MKKVSFVLLFIMAISTALLSLTVYADDGHQFNPKSPINHPSLPPKILSCFGAFWLSKFPSDIDAYISDILEPMKDAGFTACDFKLLPEDFDLRDPVQMKRLKLLAEEITKRDMVFMVYLIGHPHHAKRNPAIHSHYPPFVNSAGQEIEKFSMIYWPTWKMMYKNAFTIAALSKNIGIVAMRLDLETVCNSAISYDDYAWTNFAALHLLSDEVPKEKRFSFLNEMGLHQQYEKWFHHQLELIAQQYEAEIHSINPDIILGIMPSGNTWFYNAFTKHLATKETPAIIDSWPMYKGEGLNENVFQEKFRIEELNPYNIYIPWFRINTYRPTDMSVQAYHTGISCDGYSNYETLMLETRSKTSSQYITLRLPNDYTPDQYWNAFKGANRYILSDILDGKDTPSINYKPVTPLNASIQQGIAVPSILPAGEGTGESSWFYLRDQQVFHIYVKENQKLRAQIEHTSPHINISLSWIVLDENMEKLTSGNVLPGKKIDLEIELPKKGGYALAVTGGEGAQAWYKVKILNEHNGLFASLEPTNRFNRPYLHFFLRPFMPFDIYIARTQKNKDAFFRVATTMNNRFSIGLSDAIPLALEESSYIDVKIPENKMIISVNVDKPKQYIKGTRSENLWFGTKGAVEPYIFDGPERRIKTKTNHNM